MPGTGREEQMTPMIRLPVLVFCACGALWVGPAASQEPAIPGQTLAEVEGRSMRELRRDMRRAQERFTDLYNTLNQDRDQQIVCNDSAATGTRLTRRNCMTRAQQEARARDAVDFLAAADLAAGVEAGLDGGAADLGPVGQSVRASSPVSETPRRYITGQANTPVETSRDAYNANMERLLFEHAELYQAYEEYVEARRRFEAAQRR